MQPEKLQEIRKSIRRNWGKFAPFENIPQNHFNCFMFAICSTIPTEIFITNTTCISLLCEDVAYFGSIGQFSRTKYKTREEFKQAFKNDLKVLGIHAEECAVDFIPTKTTLKIAFYSNYTNNMEQKNVDFHFLRFFPNKNQWIGKEGFTGTFQKMKRGYHIDQIKVVNQERIGIYKLSLIPLNEQK